MTVAHSAEQVGGWRAITNAVHRAGSKIFAQLWHVGRVSHPDFHDGALPVAPSALPVEGEAFTTRGRTKLVTPRALEADELPGIVATFRAAAENAKAAGFDGVELHGANGYLLDQFLRDGSEPAHRRLWRQHREPRPLSARSHRRGDRGLGPAARGLQAVARTFPATRCRTPIRSRRFPSSPRS